MTDQETDPQEPVAQEPVEKVKGSALSAWLWILRVAAALIVWVILLGVLGHALWRLILFGWGVG